MTAASNSPGHANRAPWTAAHLIQEARKELGLGHHKSAERLLDDVLDLTPHDAEAHRLTGIAALMCGAHSKAIKHLRVALAQRPDDATVNMTLGSALIEAGANADGLKHLKRACDLAPENAEAWCNYGVALRFTCGIGQAGHMELARDALAHAVSIDPGHIKARNKLAGVMLNLGDTQAAVGMLRGTLRRRPDCVNAWFSLGNLKTEPLTGEDARQLQHLVQRPGIPDDSRILLAFTLAKALEDQSDYAAAFDVLSTANALKRQRVSWNPNEERGRVDAIARAFAGPSPEPADSTLGREVIFVVHMPRSGSTLTEQILASHPRVQGGDELQVLPDILAEESERRGQPFPHWVRAATSADWHRLGESYMERTRPLRQQHSYFTDKTPDNWALVGAALAMLPGARIVNARRDPLETCFACYRQLFLIGCHFTYDLDDMVDYYAGYQRLSALWRQKCPHRYFDNSYELLQTDTENQIRRLLDFCELPFDPACLAFHKTERAVRTISSAQVREPLQQNTARSARYGVKLDPLRAKLRAAGVTTGDA